MWVNPLFHRDRAEALTFVRRNPFATIVGSSPLQAAHLPVLLDDADNPQYLVGHIPLVDPLSEQLRRKSTALAIFDGPASYVSPSAMTSTALPTYNFVAVHVTGTAEVIDDEEFLLDHLHELTIESESAKNYAPQCKWSIQGEAAQRAATLLSRIVAYRIKIDTLEAKFKLGQNRTEDDRHNIRLALANSTNVHDREIAARMADDETRPVSR